MSTESSSRQALKAKAQCFRALHEATDSFVLPCARDALSAKIFESLGFSCVGTIRQILHLSGLDVELNSKG